MKNRYSVGGWLNFIQDRPYELLPERVGVRLKPDERMHIFKKNPICRCGYYTEFHSNEMISFINNALTSRGEWHLIASNAYEPIFALDRRVALGKVEIEYFKAYLHMWRDMDIIGFTKRRIYQSDSTFMEKTVRNSETGETKSSICFNIPKNKFLAMEDDRLYTLEELGLIDDPEEGPHLYKDDGVWKCGELYPGEFDKEDD